MRPSSFQYHKASSLEHALELLAQFGEEGRPLAGGQSLVPMMNLRLAAPDHLVDIGSLPLDRIEFTGSVMQVGALVRHRQYLADPLVERHLPALRQAVSWIGHPTIRDNGTTGGSLSHADPTAELPLAAVLYEATIVARSMSGERRIPAHDFFQDAYVTALQPGEMVTSVEFTVPAEASTGSFVEFAERRGDFAIASAGVAIEFEAETITKAAIACSGAERRPIRAREIEDLLIGKPLASPGALEAGQKFAALVDPTGDFLNSAEYRRGLIGELTKRAIEAACTKALSQ